MLGDSKVTIICTLICLSWSIILYGLLSPSDSGSGGCQVIHEIRKSLEPLSLVESFLLCGWESKLAGSGAVADCACAEGTGDGAGCIHRTVCILWKSPLNHETQEFLLAKLPAGSDVTLSQSPLVPGNVTHVFLTSPSRASLHVVSWFQQEDGAWWFDSVPPEEVADEVKRNGRFYPGTHQGLVRSVEVRAGYVLDVPAEPHVLTARLADSRYVPCDTARAHVFHTRHGRDVSSAAERFRHKAGRLLAAAADALFQLEVPFWLSSGTCLGYYRQCDFVPYMGDVDIGVRMDALREGDLDPRSGRPTVDDLIGAFARRRLRLVHRFGRPEDSFELSFRSPDDIKLDIFFFYQEADVMWNGGTQARTGKKFRYNFPAFTLCWTGFRGLHVRVPCDTEAYLRANYGPDWATPRASWDWKSSPPNVRPNGVWPQHQWPEVIQLLEN